MDICFDYKLISYDSKLTSIAVNLIMSINFFLWTASIAQVFDFLTFDIFWQFDIFWHVFWQFDTWL